jgi:hypothetical protein
MNITWLGSAPRGHHPLPEPEQTSQRTDNQPQEATMDTTSEMLARQIIRDRLHDAETRTFPSQPRPRGSTRRNLANRMRAIANRIDH